MAAVVAAVVCGGRAFSGSAAARVVDDVGADVTGRRGPSVAIRRNDRACARIRPFQHGGAHLSAADEVAGS
jgi:hypothetical protein